MGKVIIENQEALKQLYLETNLTDISSVQSTVKEIKDNVFVTGKEKYLEVLNSVNISKISRAKKYDKILSFGGMKSMLLRNIGWIIAILLFLIILIAYPDVDDAPDLMYLLVWVGIGIQIYLYNLKSAWNKLTIDGCCGNQTWQALLKNLKLWY